MTLSRAANTSVSTDVQKYLQEALGVDMQIRPWAGARKLPYFLQDAFEVHELRLRDRQFLPVRTRIENRH
jgi:hypothetical protein